MTKLDLTMRLAQESGRSAAEAADDLDELVQKILKNQRRGRSPASLRAQADAAKRQDRRPAKAAKPDHP